MTKIRKSTAQNKIQNFAHEFLTHAILNFAREEMWLTYKPKFNHIQAVYTPFEYIKFWLLSEQTEEIWYRLPYAIQLILYYGGSYENLKLPEDTKLPKVLDVYKILHRTETLDI